MTVPFVAFRSAKGRPFAERKATMISRTLLTRSRQSIAHRETPRHFDMAPNQILVTLTRA